MEQNKTVFIDANYFCGLYNPQDNLNKRSENFSKKINQKGYKVIVSNYIISEALTVLSQRVNKKASLLFWDKITNEKIKILYMNKELQQKSFNVFKKIKSKNVSFVDASIIALMKKYKIDYLLTFDKKLLRIARTFGIKSL